MVYSNKTAGWALAYATHMKARVLVCDMDFEILINRTNKLANFPNQIFNGNFYTKSKQLIRNVADANYSFKLEAIYRDQFNKSLIFDTEMNEANPDDYYELVLEAEVYNQFIGMSSFKANKYLRFFPTKWELDNNIFDEYTFTNDGKNWKLVDLSKVDKIRKLMKELIDLSEGKRVFKEDFTTEALTLFSRSITEKQEITLEEIGIYLHNRHDLFMMLFLEHNDLNFAGRSDTPVTKILKTEFQSKLTPDYMIISETSVMILEFAVTEANPLDIIDNKESKYNELVSNISTELLERGIEVFFYPVVYDMNTDQVTSNVDEINLKMDPDLTALKNFVNTIEAIPTYAAHRQLYNMTEDGIDPDAIASKESDLLDAMFDKRKKELVGITMEMAVDKEYIGKEREVFRSKFETVKEDSYLQSIVNRRADETAFTAHAISTFVDDMKAKRLSYEMDDIIMKTFLDDIKTNVQDKMDKLAKTRSNITKTSDLPKLFKIPDIPEGTAAEVPEGYIEEATLSDGTILCRSKENWDFKPSIKERGGIGLDITDMDLIDSFMEEYFSFEYFDTDLTTSFLQTKAYKYMRLLEEMAREMMLMSERRFAVKSHPCHSAFKKFGNYSLMMRKGTKMKDDSQGFFKILVETPDDLINENPLFRTFRNTSVNGTKATAWFALSLQDLEHYIKICSTYMAVLKDYETKFYEREGNRVTMTYKTMIPKFMAFPAVVMMEHKRGTSTAAQINRYLVHAATAEICNVKSLFEEVFEEPVRSRIQSYLVQKQANWFLYMLEKRKLMSEKIEKLDLSDRDYDRLLIPSIIDFTEVEFSVTMNEIYLCNLFNKDMGFKGHREKAIMNKMAAEEINYETVMDKGAGNLTVEDTLKKDKHHTYSSSFLRAAMVHYKKTRLNKFIMQTVITDSFMKLASDIIKMTKSVISCPIDEPNFTEYTTKALKDFVFITFVSQLEKYNTNQLFEIVKQDEVLLAVFGTFSKNQIGKAREILIQHIKTRLHTKFLNNFFEELCKYHEKEMITSEKIKKSLQSEMAVKMRDEYLTSKNSASPFIKIPMSLNMDSSKWAPSMIMETYLEIISELEIPDWVKDELYNTIRAYANKILFAPDSVVKKWSKKPDDEKESEEMTEWIRSRMDDDGFLWFRSGMGQGNLHHPSSFWHAVVDDYSDYLIKNSLIKIGVKDYSCRTLVSSDDCTKMMILTVPKTAVRLVPLYSLFLVDLITRCRKLANIHINWKKTALQLFMIEFNSVFSVGKRVCVATVKSIYNAFNIVDMTFPDRAVKEALGNIRRVLEDGCFLEVVDLCMKEMRQKLKEWFNLNDRMNTRLMSTLNCDEEDLPFHLGFMPTKYPVETLIFGPEIHMFKPDISDELKKFYYNMYSAERKLDDEDGFEIDAEEGISGKYTIELNTRMDKRIKKVKKEFYKDMDIKEVMREADVLAMDVNSSLLDSTTFYAFINQYLLNVTRRYEFGVSFRFNSVIRAMQLSGDDVSIKSGGSVVVKNNLVVIVKTILNLNPKTSMLRMFSTFSEIYSEAIDTETEFKMMEKHKKARHPKYRTIRFYNTKFYKKASKAEIISSLFSRDREVKGRVIQAVNEISKLLGVSSIDFYNSPFQVIYDAFSSSERPFSSFSEFLGFYDKTIGYNSVEMLLDFASYSTRRANILGIYRYRSDPEKVYISSNEFKIDEEEQKFSNRVVLLGSEAAKRSMTPDLVERISNDDSDVKVAMKLLKCSTKNSEIPLPLMINDRIYFARKGNDMAWTDLKGVVVMRMMGKAEYDVEITTSTMSGFNEELLTFVSREAIKIFAMENNSTIIGQKDMVSLKVKLRAMAASAPFRRIKTKLFFKNDVSTWRTVLRMEEFIFRICRQDLTLYPLVVDRTTSDEMSEIIQLKNPEVDLMSIISATDKVETEEITVPNARQEKVFEEEEYTSMEEMEKLMSTMILAGVSGFDTELLIPELETEDENEDVFFDMTGMLSDFENVSEMFQSLMVTSFTGNYFEEEEETHMKASQVPFKQALATAVSNFVDSNVILNTQMIRHISSKPDVIASALFTSISDSLETYRKYGLTDKICLLILTDILKKNTLRLLMPNFQNIRNLSEMRIWKEEYKNKSLVNFRNVLRTSGSLDAFY